ncbi:MAG: GNAT family N-acetyltransferase [Bacilli bacterium]|nr:GNAT family N-acetyltransferase [Bacilli bacterium]
MINKVILSDLERFNELGRLVNANFNNLFNLSSLLGSETDYIYGYYDNDELVGFIHLSKSYEVVDIVNIVVDINKRKMGIGKKLVQYVCNAFDDVESIMLEVRESNEAAINLYKKCGFVEINRRKKYYGNEDAIIMKKVISNEGC